MDGRKKNSLEKWLNSRIAKSYHSNYQLCYRVSGVILFHADSEDCHNVAIEVGVDFSQSPTYSNYFKIPQETQRCRSHPDST